MFQSICFSFPSLLLFFLEGVKSGGEERDRECGRVGGGALVGYLGQHFNPPNAICPLSQEQQKPKDGFKQC